MLPSVMMLRLPLQSENSFDAGMNLEITGGVLT